MTTPFFHDFSEATALDEVSLVELARRMDAFEPGTDGLRLDYPESPTSLGRPRPCALDRLAARRGSRREFADRPIPPGRFSALLGAARAWNGPEHRAHPAAGGRYAVELFAVCWAVDGWSGRTLYYDPVEHGVITLPDPAPSWQEALPQLGLTVTGMPGCLLIAVILPDRLTVKYGELGGRFALLEAGAVMQSLSLATTAQGLRGVVAGGLQERPWLRAVGLDQTSARLAFGYLAGM
jgi:SagB-type dehydrogenase family enzyme